MINLTSSGLNLTWYKKSFTLRAETAKFFKKQTTGFKPIVAEPPVNVLYWFVVLRERMAEISLDGD